MKILITMILFYSSLSSAQTGVYEIKNPVFPNTNIHFAFVAWNCAGESHCMKPNEFNPIRRGFAGAEYYLDENGVCKALGYEKAVENSSQGIAGSDSTRSLQVSRSGRITGAVAGVDLTQISCINKIKLDSQLEKVVFIKNPKHANGLLFSRSGDQSAYSRTNKEDVASNENEICKYLGFSRAAIQSTLNQDYNHKIPILESIKIDNEGQMSKVMAIPALTLICIE